LPAQILLLGHRGARNDAPENTLAAFDLALKHGADGFEFDVRSTSDKQSIICHDPKFHRLTIRKHTFKQLQASCPSGKESPSLEEVLERYGNKVFLNVEVKVRGMENMVLRAMKKHPPRRGYFISSFLPSVIRKLHALDGSLVLGALAQTPWQLRRWRTLPVRYVVPRYLLLSARLVESVHAAGKSVITWTVNDPRLMVRAAKLGVDGIISDNTKLLVKTLG